MYTTDMARVYKTILEQQNPENMHNALSLFIGTIIIYQNNFAMHYQDILYIIGDFIIAQPYYRPTEENNMLKIGKHQELGHYLVQHANLIKGWVDVISKLYISNTDYVSCGCTNIETHNALFREWWIKHSMITCSNNHKQDL